MKSHGVSRKSILVSGGLVWILLVLVTACTGGAISGPAAEEPALKVTWNLWPGFYPMVLAEELGLFEKHGVKVESILSDSYETMAPDFMAQKTDGVLLTLADALVIDARKPDSARIVLVVDESAGGDAVVATADIGSVADLRGKRVGASLGSFGELLVRTMLEANDLTLDDVTLVNVGPEAVPEAMPGSIEAGFTFEPFLSQAKGEGGQVVFSSSDAPGLIVDVLIFRTEVVEQRPEAVRAFMAAWFEAVDYWQKNPEKGNSLIAERLDLGVEEISLEGLKLLSLEDNRRSFERNSETISLYTSGKINADFLISSGGLSTAPDIERLVEPSFLK